MFQALFLAFRPGPSARPSCRLPGHLLLAGLAIASSLPAFAAPAAHAERRIRLTLQIEQQREAGVPKVAGQGRQRLSQRLAYAVDLISDGAPSLHNPLDPDDGARQLARAQATRQKVNAALEQQHQRGAQVAAPAPDLATMQAQAQQLLARCGQNQDCLMREAAAQQTRWLTQASGNRPGGTLSAAQGAALQAYAADWRACEKRHADGAARRACQDDARRKAGGVPDASDRDDEPETPYLHFRSPADCHLQTQVRLLDVRRGQRGDVQGVVPFENTRQTQDDQPAAVACGMQMAVLDTRNGRLWLGSGLPLPQARVQYRHAEGRHVQQQGEELQNLDWHEAGDWLQRRLLTIDRQGSDQITLPAGPGAGAAPDGQTRVQVRWTAEGL